MLRKRTAIALTLILALLGSVLAGFVPPSSMAVSEALEPLWSKTYGPYHGFDAIQTNDQGFAIAGQNAIYGVHGYNDYEPSIIKTNSSGEQEWRASLPVGGYAISVVQTEDSGFAIGCRPGGWFLSLTLKVCAVEQNTWLNYLLCYSG